MNRLTPVVEPEGDDQDEPAAKRSDKDVDDDTEEHELVVEDD